MAIASGLHRTATRQPSNVRLDRTTLVNRYSPARPLDSISGCTKASADRIAPYDARICKMGIAGTHLLPKSHGTTSGAITVIPAKTGNETKEHISQNLWRARS